jgi:anti-sigma factor RsiW
MEITNELLAAYAEGNVTPEERKAVREYLTEHPSQLESVMMMMDEDYVLEKNTKQLFSESRHGIDYVFPKSLNKTKVGIVGNAVADNLIKPQCRTFGEEMNRLLDEIDSI